MVDKLTIKRCELTDNALKVLQKRYLKKDEKPEEMFSRVALNIASAEKICNPEISDGEVINIAQSFYDIMCELKFLPNSPTLMNAGSELQQLSACFVIPVEDSVSSIFDAVKHAALIHKSGGGTGFSFSKLRPKNSVVRTTGGVASGPVSFMKVFNAATEAIKQGGTRRGANMGILRVDHPDILEFISCKANEKELTNFNISVAVTDGFMEAVKREDEYNLIDPSTKKITGKLSAPAVFNEIVKNAWFSGEPGIIFIDKINKAHPILNTEIESTNPCGEQPLLPYESCNLGSINLSKFVKEGKEFDWAGLSTTISTAVRFLDNVIDVNNYPLKEVEAITKANRKIGLGVMGWADALIKLGIPYHSEQAIDLAEKIGRFISEEARKASGKLAELRGSFPNIKNSKWAGQMMRNATLTTIAPTGTLSIIAGCSSGIEPLFAVSYYRRILDRDELPEIHPFFLQSAKKFRIYSEELIKKIAGCASIQEIDGIPKELKNIFVVAHDIKPEWHIRMQAAFQKYVDNAVSKTVNLPNDATFDDVRKVFLLAYELGCKGVTVYRDRSREEQVLNVVPSEKLALPKDRPDIISGATIRQKTGCGSLFVTVNKDDSAKPFEVFCIMGKSGGCAMSMAEAIGRLTSLALRSGIPVEKVIDQLSGVMCHRPVGLGREKILSCADAIAKALRKNDNPKSEHNSALKVNNKGPLNGLGACPSCRSGYFVYESGCATCMNCGYSECL
uniref:Vitamin B12-dependent ribonucleotide reductase n=1 Tax=candidate division WOR-3 bacterium TaxID=2052148 RepID=A0A7V1EH65_UNCW3